MLAATPSVLIVDDIPANLLALAAVLAPLNARVVSAHSGESALALTRQQNFALALLDLRMPGLSGSQTAALMRELPAERRLPIIILTAHTLTDADIEEAYCSGVVDILQKPFSANVLRTKASLFLELYRQREQLLLQQKQLRDDFERQLLGIVSHDLRSPLTAIALGAEHLCRAGIADLEHQVAERVRLAANRAIRLTHDLLDLTSVRHTGKLQLAATNSDIYELASRAVDELCAVFPSCTFDLRRSGDTMAVIDTGRIAQAIVNVINNAARHSTGGKVGVSVTGTSSEVSVAVHNFGEAIPDSVLSSLFEPFRRGTAADCASHSVGLGLFIVDQIVRAHGGHVDARSSADAGTTFTLSLPRKPAEKEI